MALYSFVPSPLSDTHPPDDVTTLADAIYLANEYLTGQPDGTTVSVRDSDGNEVYLAGATPFQE